MLIPKPPTTIQNSPTKKEYDSSFKFNFCKLLLVMYYRNKGSYIQDFDEFFKDRNSYMLLSDALLGYQELASLPIKHHFDVSEINSYKYAIDFLKQLSENFYIDLDDSLPYPKITKIYSEAILELSESYLP